MQAECSICGEFKRDCDFCPKCAKVVCLQCFEIRRGRCTACVVAGGDYREVEVEP